MSEELQLTNFSHSSFHFDGFPDLYQYRRVLFLPFFGTYVMGIAGNSLLLHVIFTCPTLHSPMYLLISCLAFVNILVPTAIIPKMLLGFLFDWNEISLTGCLLQMFFTHFLSSVESTILLAMALDRLVAICNPLRYPALVNTSAFLKLVAFTLIRSGSIFSSLVILAQQLPFCGSNIIHHCYCDHMALVSLACGSKSSSEVTGLVVIVCFVGVDISIIIFSYSRIISVVLLASDGEDRWKAFHTCGTHLIIMMCFYLVGSITFLSHNLHINITSDLNSFLGVLYIILPACMNPIIYGIRTKEIKTALWKMLKINRNKVLPTNVATITV